MKVVHPTKGDSLADVIERILDKGVVINADIVISLVGTELLSVKIRAALASFETAAKWGLAFPSDTCLLRAEPQVQGCLPAERT